MYRRMTKYLYIFLGILTLLLGACSRPDAEDVVIPDATTTPVATSSSREVTSSISPSPSPTTAPTSTLSPRPTATSSPISTSIPTATPEPTKIPSPEKPMVVGEDGILADNELCKVQLVSFGIEESDVVLRFSVENRSEKDLIFSARDILCEPAGKQFS